MPDILVVADDLNSVDTFSRGLETQGAYHVEIVDTNLAVSFLESGNFDVAIIDCISNEKKGRDVLERIVKHFSDIGCIMLTKNVSIENCETAVGFNGVDCITKSASADDLLNVIKKVTDRATSNKQGNKGDVPDQNRKFSMMIGESKEIKSVFNIIEKVADTDSTVLITGESGTGKELIARAIHSNSSRRENPMVVINCGAIPPELLESELFGHEKGAFTGAHRTRIGRFEMADGSTVFLDEIGDMSPNLQVKLLRVLQEQSFERVGSTKSINVDIRVLAATNKDLISSIEDGSFRQDLFYRLNVIPIRVAALRQRRQDVPLLVNYFQKRLSERKGHNRKKFSDAAMEILVRYNWPGNIRELENLMERLYVLIDHEMIKASDLPDNITGTSTAQRKGAIENPYVAGLFNDGIGFNEALEQYQKDLILHALKKTNWVKAKAAELLQMNRTTLVEKIKKMKIEATSVL